MDKELRKTYRSFLKGNFHKVVHVTPTDQQKRVPPPPIEKPYAEDAKRIALPAYDQLEHIGRIDLKTAIEYRKSRRVYTRKPLSIEELSFLLWATQGIRQVLNPGTAFRTVPSAGCRHAFETYLCILNVEGIDQGIYRYLPLAHQLLFEFTEEHLAGKISRLAFNQNFPQAAAVNFIWTAVPYKMEWRYGPACHKVIAIEIGHVCQNLYLACEAVGAGICAMAAYDQEAMDSFLRLDGEDEFTIYLASVGKNL